MENVGLELYDRTLRLIGEERLRKIRSLRIGVVGCGIVGQIIPAMLSRIGVAELRLLDKDVVKIENLANSFLFTKRYLGWKKANAAADIAKKYSLDGRIAVKPYHFDITDSGTSLLEFLDGLNLVYGCLDNLPARYALNFAALKSDVKYVDVGVGGFACRVRLIDRSRACYVCDPLVPEKTSINIFRLLPDKADEGCNFAPTASMLPVSLIASSIAVSIGLAYLGIIGEPPGLDYYYFHLFSNEIVAMKITKREDCIVCGENGEVWWQDHLSFSSNRVNGESNNA